MSLWASIKQARSARLRQGPITRPVKLTVDETDLIPRIALYMLYRRGLPTTTQTLMLEGLRSVWEMIAINSAHGYFISFPWRRSISREDLDVLAPYIDEWIDKPPPQEIPSEYHDWRPDVLKSFRARMLNEGFWPAHGLANPA
jgi:hypothetical protein